MRTEPLVGAAAQLSTAIRALPELTKADGCYLSHLSRALFSTVQALNGAPTVPTFLDDLVHYSAERTFTATIPSDN